MFFSEVVFCLILFIVCFVESAVAFGAYHREHLREGDECLDEATGETGMCVPMNHCRSFHERPLHHMQHGTTCWYGNGTFVFCCLEPFISWDPPDERTISQKMCLEYNKDVLLWFVDTPPPRPTSHPRPPRPPHPATSRSCANRVRRSPFMPTVYGGIQTKPHEFPHMAALGWPTITGQLDFKCGGTLVSDLFVLTAGHCTTASSRDTELTSKEPTVIRLGVDELHGDHSSRQDASVNRIVRHSSYKPPATYNDIALIELKTPVELNSFVRPACLWHKDNFDNDLAIVTGWGATSHTSDTSNILLKGDISVFSNEFCQPLLEHLRNRKWKHGLSPEQMCAGDLERKHDSCRGDSGGPLQINLDSEPNIHYVVGVTSFGDSCPATTGVAVYTRVSSFIPWIETVVWPNQEDD